MVQRFTKFIGEWINRFRGYLYTALCLALIGWSAYNLGLITGNRGTKPLQEAAVFSIRQSAVSQAPAAGRGSPTPNATHTDPRVVASKASSSKKYHYAWCAGASKIKEANRLWFSTAAAAEAAGYTLAGNCTP